jgi:DNA-directed RNA polymerase subunit A'
MFLRMLEMRGFTLKLDDVAIDEEGKKQILQLLQEAFEKVRNLVEQYVRRELEVVPGRSMEESLEIRILEVLAEARDKAGDVAVSRLNPFNNAFVMARTGARGNILNLTQMAATLGQMTVRGERIWRGYMGRPLPHFKRNDLGAISRGFVVNNFYSGLSVTEMFMHAAGGREGLVDTAVRTSQSGYMQRRLVNALIDLHVEYDYTVRDSNGSIIQFIYGEDKADPTRAPHGKIVNVERIIERVLGAA